MAADYLQYLIIKQFKTRGMLSMIKYWKECAIGGIRIRINNFYYLDLLNDIVTLSLS